MLKMLKTWDTLSFKVNPYGKNIPDYFLYSPLLLKTPRNEKDAKCLADLNQNGYVMTALYNDKTKLSPAERKNLVFFSDIFKECVDTETLCPANYVVKIIEKLDEIPTEELGEYPFDTYLGTITRGLRAFASYLRELVLQTIIEDYLMLCSCEYSFHKVTPEMDAFEKTDIFFTANNQQYRVWSYQSTDIGCEKTAKRILHNCGEGLNILIPFNRFEDISQNVYGWDIYNEVEVYKVLDKVFVSEPLPYSEMKRRIGKNFEEIKQPVLFYVYKGIRP